MSGEVVRWIFDDPYTGDTWTVPINPNVMTTPFSSKNVTSATTQARTGQAILWEGAAKPVDWSFGGVILDQAHLETLKAWADRPNRVYITDHFGRKWEVYITGLDAVPKRAVMRYWRHDYTMKALLLRRVS